MIRRHTTIAIAISTLFTVSAWAQAPAGAGTPSGQVIQRDINQQQRIENGLQSGALTTREASQLEKRESRVSNMESRDLRNGPMTPQEQMRINRAQNRVSRDITRDAHNGRTGNPDSVSSRRMQAEVQRNVNQQRRIEQGVQSGELDNRETGRLEHGQARDDRREWRAGRDGRVGAGEQHRIQSAENHQSAMIHRDRHDGPRNFHR